MRKFEFVRDDILIEAEKEEYLLKKPRRSTNGSAGYDFFAPFDITLEPGKSIVIPTFFKIALNDGEALWILPRSSFGYKFDMMIKSTVGLIDKDYYGNIKNDGNILIGIKNNSDKVLHINRGEHYAQGVIVPFLITDDDDEFVKEERTGGIGSTTK